MKIRVWGYRDGTLLPDGFELDPQSEKAGSKVYSMVDPGFSSQELAAALEALIGLCNSMGIEVCLGDDSYCGDEPNFNMDVVNWLEPDGTNTPADGKGRQG